MEVTMCPACSGSGRSDLAEVPCALCDGLGDVTVDLAEEFWECIASRLRKDWFTRACISVSPRSMA